MLGRSPQATRSVIEKWNTATLSGADTIKEARSEGEEEEEEEGRGDEPERCGGHSQCRKDDR